jgi:hypothetical protein
MTMWLLLPLALLTGGLGAGVLTGTVLGPVPLYFSLPAERYVEVHQFLANRYEPFQPICLTVTLLADVAAAAIAPSIPVRILCALAAATLAGAIAVSATRNVPLKRRVLALDPAALPSDFHEWDPRRVWAAWNLVRTVLAVTSLACNVVAAAVLL